MEVWDAYDSSLNIIEDTKLIRGREIPQGMYHLVSEIIVRHIDGTFLLMQRDLKKNLGGKWELTAGGFALSGEDPIDCAYRELKEETGIDSKVLKEVNRFVHQAHQTIYVLYECVVDMDKEAIALQVGETIDFAWLDSDTIFKMNRDLLVSPRSLSYLTTE